MDSIVRFETRGNEEETAVRITAKPTLVRNNRDPLRVYAGPIEGLTLVRCLGKGRKVDSVQDRARREHTLFLTQFVH
jgi:hypothetical protein